MVLALLLVTLLPFQSFAQEEDMGTIVINILDGEGEAMTGNWFLHRGISRLNTTVRNGANSETFLFSWGTYFLETQPVHQHPFHMVESENPQLLMPGETITYNVFYFKTEEEMVMATGELPDTPIAAAQSGYAPGVVIDEYGCNRTLGYVWCERDQMCVTYWTPICKVTSDVRVTETEVVLEPDQSPDTPISDASTRITYFVDTGDVPTFETQPSTSTAAEASAAETTEEFELAQTGTSGLMVLAGSMLLGSLMAFRRKQ